MNKTLRFMLVSLLTMLCGTVMAEQVTMKYSGTTTTNMTCDGNEAATLSLDASEWSVTADKGGSPNAPGLNKAGDFRLYWHANGSNTITVSSLTEATINNISMTFNGTSYSNVTVTVNGNPVTADDEGVYTINSTSFVLSNGNTSNTQVRIKEVVIDYTPAGSLSDTRTATTISAGNNQEGIVGTTMNLPAAVVKAGETAIDGAVVTWTSSDVEVAKIDGTTLQLLKAGTATITASFEGDENYKPCQDSFTLTVKEAPVNIANIAAATALENDKEFNFTGELLVVAKPTDRYVYVKDATGASLIYAYADQTTAVEVGKTIAANWTGKVSIFNKLFELVPAAALVMKEGEAVAVEYPEVTSADITAENINKVVTLKGITSYTVSGKNMTIKVGETEIPGYNQFGLTIDDAVEGKTYKMVGAISRYNDNIQFQPISIEEVVEVAHTWDFTKWSEETVNNLKAEAAKVQVEDMGEGKTNLVSDNGALWSDHEKAKQTDPSRYNTTYAASKNNCFWYVGGQATPTANGTAIAEFTGLEFNTTYGTKRSLAIAVNYPATTLGEYHGPAYLWFGGKPSEIMTIKNVKAGTQIKMGVESHKAAEARGVKLFVNNDTELTDPEGATVAAPTVYAEQTWQVPAGEGVVDVVVKNTDGCHIYFIDAEIDNTTTGITTVNTEVKVAEDIFNLRGQKVEKAVKGLYIINGKKFMVK